MIEAKGGRRRKLALKPPPETVYFAKLFDGVAGSRIGKDDICNGVSDR